MTAARDWLTVTSCVPVWTGASKSTFLRLASYVGYVLTINFEAGVTKKVRKELTEVGVSQSEATFTAGNGVYEFSYSTDLQHLFVNEYHDANVEFGLHLKHPGPYEFQRHGQSSFMRSLERVVFPDWWKFVSLETKQVT